MEFHEEHLRMALQLAIAAQTKIEKEYGFKGDSGMLSVWKMMLQTVNNGRDIRLKH